MQAEVLNGGALQPCERCRKRLPVVAVFCPRCGIRVREMPVTPAIATLPQWPLPARNYSVNRTIEYASPRRKYAAAGKKGGGGWVLAVVGFMVFRVIVAGNSHRSTSVPAYKPPTYTPSFRPPPYTPPAPPAYSSPAYKSYPQPNASGTPRVWTRPTPQTRQPVDPQPIDSSRQSTRTDPFANPPAPSPSR
jgi:hypothetical protein